jgi:hypothetical protein
LKEAQEECERALSVPNYHRNIALTLEKIKSAPEKENEEEQEIIRCAEPLSAFYRQFGWAAVRIKPTAVQARWIGPDCELEITIDGDTFEAAGSYERQPSALTFALALGSGRPPPERYQVIYRGTIHGRAVQASVSRAREGDPPKGLLSIPPDPKVLMFIVDDATEIRAMEMASGSKARFYSLTRPEAV